MISLTEVQKQKCVKTESRLVFAQVGKLGVTINGLEISFLE